MKLHPGLMDFCDFELDSDCYSSKYQHLGEYLNIRCKPNYYFYNGFCIFTGINC